MPMNLFLEQGYGMNYNVQSAPSNSYLRGFWQSESYFADIRETLLEELNPLAAPSVKDLAVIEAMHRPASVSLHVRRGDYVSLSSAAAFHGLCGLDYYNRAVDYIAERVESLNVFIFSDDPQWVRENLKLRFPVYYIDHNNSANAFQDLRLMSYCMHHVIANSSFSWWGAWLAKFEKKIVVSPSKWFQVERPTPDLLPTDWVRV